MNTNKIALISAVVVSAGCVFISGSDDNIASAGVSTVTSLGGVVRADGTRNPSQLITYPDGGIAYVYDINGVKNTFPVPPKGFNPLTASAESLARYGFPPKPANPNQLNLWTDVVKHWHETTPTLELGPASKIHGSVKNISLRPSILLPNTTDSYPSYSNRWSGYIVNASSPSFNEWKAVQGDYYQPFRGSNSNAMEASWVGIGGKNAYPTKMIQAGTFINWKGQGTYQAWYETFSDQYGDIAAQPVGLVVRPGDHIHVYVDYEGSNSTIYLANESTGNAVPVKVQMDASYWDGSTAEFIDERPTYGTSMPPLDNYDHVNWSNAQVYSIYGYWNPLGSLSNERMILTSDGTYLGAVLSEPDALSSNTSFTDHWHQSQ